MWLIPKQHVNCTLPMSLPSFFSYVRLSTVRPDVSESDDYVRAFYFEISALSLGIEISKWNFVKIFQIYWNILKHCRDITDIIEIFASKKEQILKWKFVERKLVILGCWPGHTSCWLASSSDSWPVPLASTLPVSRILDTVRAAFSAKWWSLSDRVEPKLALAY